MKASTCSRLLWLSLMIERRLKRFQAKWAPVRVKKTRQIKNLARPIREGTVFLVRLTRPLASSDEAHRIAFGFSPPDDRYFATRLRIGLGVQGRTPRRSRTEREQRAGQAAEEVGFGTCRGEREANAARGLAGTGGEFSGK